MYRLTTGDISLNIHSHTMDIYETALRKLRSDKRDNKTLAHEIGLPKETVRDIRSGHVEYPRLPTLRLIYRYYEKAA